VKITATLLSTETIKKSRWELTFEERLDLANKLKAEGNATFKKGSF